MRKRTVLRALAMTCAASAVLPASADQLHPLLDSQGRRALSDERGVDVALSYNSEDLGNTSGGNRQTFSHAGQVSLTVDADLGKAMGWEGASFRLGITQRDGIPLDKEAGFNTLFWTHASSGRGQVTRLTTLWLEDTFLNDSLTIRAGRLNVGHDFEDVSCYFINLALCGNQSGSTGLSYWFNHPIPQWGATAKYATSANTYAKVGIYQVNPEAIDPRNRFALNPSGSTGVLTPVEFGWTPNLRGTLKGTYMAGAWYSNTTTDDVRDDIFGGNAGGTGLERRQRTGAYGAYVSAEQQLIQARGPGLSQGLKGIAKAVYSDERTSTTTYSVAAGLVQQGIGTRAHDQIGIGVAVSQLNSRVSAAREARYRYGLTAPGGGHEEYLIEGFYGWQATPWLFISPGFQWIHRPAGSSRLEDIFIYQARTAINF